MAGLAVLAVVVAGALVATLVAVVSGRLGDEPRDRRACRPR